MKNLGSSISDEVKFKLSRRLTKNQRDDIFSRQSNTLGRVDKVAPKLKLRANMDGSSHHLFRSEPVNDLMTHPADEEDLLVLEMEEFFNKNVKSKFDLLTEDKQGASLLTHVCDLTYIGLIIHLIESCPELANSVDHCGKLPKHYIDKDYLVSRKVVQRI